MVHREHGIGIIRYLGWKRVSAGNGPLRFIPFARISFSTGMMVSIFSHMPAFPGVGSGHRPERAAV